MTKKTASLIKKLGKGAVKAAPKAPSIPNPTKKIQDNVKRAQKLINPQKPSDIKALRNLTLNSVAPDITRTISQVESAAHTGQKIEKTLNKVSQVRRVRNSQRAAKRILSKYQAQGLTVSSKLKSIIYDKSSSYSEKKANAMIERMRETEHELGIYRTDRQTGKTYGRVVSLYQKKPSLTFEGPDGKKVVKYRYIKRTPEELEQLKYKAAFSSAKKILSPGHFADVDRVNFTQLMKLLDKYGGGNVKLKLPTGDAARTAWFASLGINAKEFAAAATAATSTAPLPIAEAVSHMVAALIDNPKSSETFYRDTLGHQQFKKWQQAMQINPKFKDISQESFDRIEKFFRTKAGRTFMKRVSQQVDSDTFRIIITRNDKIDAKLLLDEFSKLNLDPNDPGYADKLNRAISDIIDDMSVNAVSADM